jgi:diacylglycerol O-acyltransferase / wax synthase
VVKPRTGLGMPKWVDDKHYDLRAHLYRVALPDPDDKHEFQEMISGLMTTALDLNKPL